MSGLRPLLRSPKLADGMTSETTEESGVNVFMFALPLGVGRARRRFRSGLAAANEPASIGQLKPGGTTAKLRFQHSVAKWLTILMRGTIPAYRQRRNHGLAIIWSFLATVC